MNLETGIRTTKVNTNVSVFETFFSNGRRSHKQGQCFGQQQNLYLVKIYETFLQRKLFHQGGSCRIPHPVTGEEQCYKNGELNPWDATLVCNATLASTEWSSSTGCLASGFQLGSISSNQGTSFPCFEKEKRTHQTHLLHSDTAAQKTSRRELVGLTLLRVSSYNCPGFFVLFIVLFLCVRFCLTFVPIQETV